MASTIIDLRSDTVTQPTAAMRAAMLSAPLGDDVFGDDPTVNALQSRIAAMLGKEDALFLPTGTQSNLTALMSHCQRGDEFIVGQGAHTYRYEGGGGAVLGSIQPQPITNQSDGTLALADIEGAIKPDDAHFARTRLLCLENTFGGQVLSMDYLREATALARRHGLATHLDGARLFNAAVAMAADGGDAKGHARDTSEPRAVAREMADLFDTVSVCFSKGLGAPVGAALAGSKDYIAEAWRVKQRLGGAMRQAGIIAAGALHALEHHVDRLAEDHANARRLAAGLAGIEGIVIDPATVETNLVYFSLAPRAALDGSRFCDALRAQGVRMGALGPNLVRAVTHLDVDGADIDAAIAAVARVLAR